MACFHSSPKRTPRPSIGLSRSHSPSDDHGDGRVAEHFLGDVPDDQRRAVERVGRDLTGATVAEATETRITVRTMLDAAEVSVRQSVRQLRFVALSLHRDATAALTGDAAPPDPNRDDQADRLYALVDRHFTRGLARLDEVDALGLTRTELFELRTTARELERVADHAERIGTLAAEGPPPDGQADEFRTVARTARGVVDDAVGAVVGDRDAGAAQRALAGRDALREDVAALDRRLAPDADYRSARAFDSLRRTAEHGGTVAELALRAAVRRGDLSDVTDVAGEHAPAE